MLARSAPEAPCSVLMEPQGDMPSRLCSKSSSNGRCARCVPLPLHLRMTPGEDVINSRLRLLLKGLIGGLDQLEMLFFFLGKLGKNVTAFRILHTICIVAEELV